jgi:hypothetical protein
MGMMNLHYFGKSEKIIFVYLVIALVTEISTFIYEYLFNSENMLIINSYVIIEMATICLFYFYTLSYKRFRFIILAIITLFILFSIFQMALERKGISNISLTFESIIIIVLSILLFNDLLINTRYSNILSAPIFWINSGFLLFFSGNLILHLFSQFLQTYAQKALYELWGFHSVLNIILYILISIGFWKTRTLQT